MKRSVPCALALLLLLTYHSAADDRQESSACASLAAPAQRNRSEAATIRWAPPTPALVCVAVPTPNYSPVRACMTPVAPVLAAVAQ